MQTKLSIILPIIALTAIAAIAVAVPTTHAETWVTLNAGDLLKLPDDGNPSTNVDTAVYYYGADGMRYVFPNPKTYFTWYSDFAGVKVITSTQLGTIGIGGNVTYRPGVKMIKVESDPRTFIVDKNGRRRHLTSETAARDLYGANWNRMVDDVPDSFFSNYRDGDEVNTATDFDKASALGESPNISIDKDLQAPVEVVVNADGSFNPSTVSISAGRAVRFQNRTGSTVRVASDPHPEHNTLPGFDSAYIPNGLNYVFRFTRTGSWGFHNDSNSSKIGTVTVQ